MMKTRKELDAPFYHALRGRAIQGRSNDASARAPANTYKWRRRSEIFADNREGGASIHPRDADESASKKHAERVRLRAAGREKSVSPSAESRIRRAQLTAFACGIHAECAQMSCADPCWRSTCNGTWDRVWISLHTSMREACDCTSITREVQARCFKRRWMKRCKNFAKGRRTSRSPNERAAQAHHTCPRHRKARRHLAPGASAHGTTRTRAPETQQQIAADHPPQMREMRDAFLRSCDA